MLKFVDCKKEYLTRNDSKFEFKVIKTFERIVFSWTKKVSV